MDGTEISRSDRVNIDDSVIAIYKELTDNASVESAPFKTMKDAFVFAACLGFQKGSRKTLPGGKKHTIRMEVLSERDVILLRAIAIAETKDVLVLSQLGEVLTIAEEYAYAGIYHAKELLLDQGGRPLWNLVDMLFH
jgi:dnd system-associated protein 4